MWRSWRCFRLVGDEPTDPPHDVFDDALMDRGVVSVHGEGVANEGSGDGEKEGLRNNTERQERWVARSD